MIGWLWLAAIAALILAALWALRLPRPVWSMAGAALMLGAAGYALTGQPGLPGRLASPAAPALDDDTELNDLRDRMVGRFTGDGAYLIAADAMTRTGDRDAAVGVILGGIRHVPDSMKLWTGLGTALAAHDGDRVSPPALFAFQQAMRLSPRHPAPPFFLGIAYVRAGEFTKARGAWRRALALTPPDVSYRREIAMRLALLDQYLGAMGER